MHRILKSFCYPAVWHFLVIAGCFFRAPANISVHEVTLQRACKPGLFVSSGAADGGLFGRGFQKGGSPALAAVGFLRAGL